MLARRTLRELDFDEALEHFDNGAVFIDLRPTDEYLDVHVPGSIALFYERGPGMPTRARDCIPLEIPLILIDDERADLVHTAASLRGKGFTVLGHTGDAVNQWIANGGKPGSTDVLTGAKSPSGLVLDVADPGAKVPEEARRIPADVLWQRAEELPADERLVVAGGYGVRAALAIGILERAGASDLAFWKTLVSDEAPARTRPFPWRSRNRGLARHAGSG